MSGKSADEKPKPLVPSVRTKAATPEQIERRRIIEARSALMAEQGLPQPKSGTWGGKPTGGSRDA